MKTLKILGSPGCGKTHRQLQLFEKELETISPRRIAFLTFTRAAREEALRRAVAKTGKDEREFPFIKTIHAVCYSQLSMSQEQLVKPKDLVKFGETIGADIRGTLHDPWSLDELTGENAEPSIGDRLLHIIHLGRHRKLTLKPMLADVATDIDFDYAKWFVESFKAWKQAQMKHDFTDLLLEYLRHCRPLDIDVLFVDEAQDLSALQWDVVRKLGARAQRRYLGGDDDQAIYVWAGADASLFQDEPCDTTEVLPQSYRMPASVHRLSTEVISRVSRRLPKEFKPREVEGEVLETVQLDVDHLLDAKGSFILYRNHFRGQMFANLLQNLGWPYKGTYSPLNREDVREALIGFQKIFTDGALTTSEARAATSFINPARKGGWGASVPWRQVFTNHTSVPMGAWNLADWLPRLPKVDYIDRCLQTQSWEEVFNPPVTLQSIHQSKGQEASTVILDLVMSRRTYDEYQTNPDNEHRVYYVGITRTRERLITLTPTEPTAYNL